MRISDVTVGRTPLAAETAVIIPLTAIRGIGEARARQLAEIGIESIEKLATALPQDVRQIRGVDVDMAAQFIAQAKVPVASRRGEMGPPS
jgi:predicted RecB family nuclease